MGTALATAHDNLDKIADVLEEEQKRTGIKLLWGTANMFSNPRRQTAALDMVEHGRLNRDLRKCGDIAPRTEQMGSFTRPYPPRLY